MYEKLFNTLFASISWFHFVQPWSTFVVELPCTLIFSLHKQQFTKYIINKLSYPITCLQHPKIFLQQSVALQ